ncbi:MAG: hypothetical protein ABF325_05230 [Lentimonas sp.]
MIKTNIVLVVICVTMLTACLSVKDACKDAGAASPYKMANELLSVDD